jgi:O-antigen/teichoic acid export membrane protein
MGDRFVRGVAVVLLLEGASLILRFGMQVVLARSSTVAGYGLFSYGMSTAQLLAVPAGLGLQGAALRFVPVYVADGRPDLLCGFVSRSRTLTLGAGVAIAAIAIAVSALTGAWRDDPAVFVLAMGLIPFLGLSTLQGETLRGGRNLVAARIVPTAVYPCAVIATALGLYLALGELGAMAMLCAAVFGTLLGVALQQLLMWRRRYVGRSQSYEQAEWFAVARPLLGVKAAQMVTNQSDIILVGLMLGPREAGIYTAATKTAVLASFVLSASNLALVPEVAAAHVAGDRAALSRALRTGAKLAFIPSVGITVGLVAGGGLALRAFGGGFTEGAEVLSVLAVGRLANAVTGPVGAALNVTGHAKLSARIYGLAAMFQVGLAILLIRPFGMTGAAVASASCMLFTNATLYVLVGRTLEVRLWPRPLERRSPKVS